MRFITFILASTALAFPEGTNKKVTSPVAEAAASTDAVKAAASGPVKFCFLCGKGCDSCSCGSAGGCGGGSGGGYSGCGSGGCGGGSGGCSSGDCGGDGGYDIIGKHGGFSQNLRNFRQSQANARANANARENARENQKN